jgi:hypothetical protein
VGFDMICGKCEFWIKKKEKKEEKDPDFVLFFG